MLLLRRGIRRAVTYHRSHKLARIFKALFNPTSTNDPAFCLATCSTNTLPVYLFYHLLRASSAKWGSENGRRSAPWELINIQPLRRICMLTSSQVIPEHVLLRSRLQYLLATSLPPCLGLPCSLRPKCPAFLLPLGQIVIFLVPVSWTCTLLFPPCHDTFENWVLLWS